MKGWYTFCRNVSSPSGFPVKNFLDFILKVVHFAQDLVVHFRQELLVHFAQELVVQFGQEYSLAFVMPSPVCPELSQGTKIRKFFESDSKTLIEMIDSVTDWKRANP